MKKHLIFPLICFLISCNQPIKKKQEALDKSQSELLTLIDSLHNSFSYSMNDILKSEWEERFKSIYLSKVDSIGYFENWKGKLMDIELVDANDNIQVLRFNIETKFNNGESDFDLVSGTAFYKDETENHLINNQVKNLGNHSIVYVDGFIQKDENGINFRAIDSDLYISPDVRFYTVSISEKPLKSKSQNLTNILELDRKNIFKVPKKLRKNMSGRDYQKYLDLKGKEYNARVLNLSDEEKEYLQSYTIAICRSNN